MDNTGQRSKFDMASLLGSDTGHVNSQTPNQQLPPLASVLQKRNDGVSRSITAPLLSTQIMKQESHLSVKAPEPRITNGSTKRRSSECEDEKDASTPTSKRCRGKWRKPTYLVRKEEKCELLEHIKELESQVSFLQNRTNIVAWQKKDRQQIETEIKNHVLRTSNLVERRTQFMTEAQGLKTVAEAFKFIQFHIKHMHTKPTTSKYICTSELGAEKNIMHRRLIISEVENVATETNFVMFSEQWPGANRHGMCGDTDKAFDQGVMVTNFVDEDDLYPYRPQNCVRLDLSGVMALRSYRKLVKTPKGEDKEVSAVVLTRWMLQKLRHTELPVPKHVLQTMRDRINEPGNAILRAVKKARAGVQLEANDIKVLSV
ncbi:uncharacterized protein PITG_12447 [Phytophthora infestans T30-4]|uniref:Uncharacterized protein n=1 Tax=Phytophthora infestans (strain T30-4) TaxID=403677 RepID=D0NKJ3_PHYIT|nr:uncharacterized protein PITG_12447 [Phytophthora infestans T30-4]EEY60129.1 conserved hypothetical protein [Phytophthora infestans T30-4]|eukprot:XP_002900336.1 conserved hypothetical protein [Phytophthora infestans T30-4]